MARSGVLCLVVLTAVLTLLPGKGQTPQQHYDLGGACLDRPGHLILPSVETLMNRGETDHAIDAAKESIRDSCANEYRWLKLAEVLIGAHRDAEAVRAIEEMDSRGFDLNPTSLTLNPRVLEFMSAPVFEASAIGAHFAQLRKTSDERRETYRRMLASLPPGQRPPEDYIAHGACPFECCQYGMWKVTHDTALVAEPGSSRIVGRATAGTSIRALTGEVHLRPVPVLVVGGHLPRNSIVFILDYMGEGSGHVWVAGQVAEIENQMAYAQYCWRPSDTCWGETLLDPKEKPNPPVWWVRIRLADGTVGWTDHPDNFEGQDGCG